MIGDFGVLMVSGVPVLFGCVNEFAVLCFRIISFG